MMMRFKVYRSTECSEGPETMIDAETRIVTPSQAAAVRLKAPTSALGGLFDEHLPNIAHRLAGMGLRPGRDHRAPRIL